MSHCCDCSLVYCHPANFSAELCVSCQHFLVNAAHVQTAVLSNLATACGFASHSAFDDCLRSFILLAVLADQCWILSCVPLHCSREERSISAFICSSFRVTRIRPCTSSRTCRASHSCCKCSCACQQSPKAPISEHSYGCAELAKAILVEMLGLGAYGLGITQAMLQGAQGSSHTSPTDMSDGLRQVWRKISITKLIAVSS